MAALKRCSCTVSTKPVAAHLVGAGADEHVAALAGLGVIQRFDQLPHHACHLVRRALRITAFGAGRGYRGGRGVTRVHRIIRSAKESPLATLCKNLTSRPSARPALVLSQPAVPPSAAPSSAPEQTWRMKRRRGDGCVDTGRHRARPAWRKMFSSGHRLIHDADGCNLPRRDVRNMRCAKKAGGIGGPPAAGGKSPLMCQTCDNRPAPTEPDRHRR